MKKTLVAAALLGAFAGVAQAQTAVQIYGNLDVGAIAASSADEPGASADDTLDLRLRCECAQQGGCHEGFLHLFLS